MLPVPSGKPAKPYPEFPLTAHPAGYWCKKIRGKIHYFGPWNDPDGALKKYLEQKDALHAGRTPRADPEGVTVKEVCNAFLNAKQALMDAGELSRRMWSEYKEVCDLLVSQFGKGRHAADLGPSDFAALRKKMAKRWGPSLMPGCRGLVTRNAIGTVEGLVPASGCHGGWHDGRDRLHLGP
jgi:hypothetical protein